MMSSEYDEREQAELNEEISASIDTGGEEVEEWPDFPIDSFQVVRNQFFAHTREPSVSLKGGKMSVNTACLNKMPGVDYIQVLINQITKTLVLRPCQESDIYSIQWCTYRAKDRKRNPRIVTARLFYLKVCELMGWNPDFRYKIIGKMVRSNGQYLFVFNMADTDTFVYEKAEDGDKIRFSRTPIFPAEWQHQFGIPYEEARNALQVNTFDGYEVYVIKDQSPGNERAGDHDSDDTSDTQSTGSHNPYLGGGVNHGSTV